MRIDRLDIVAFGNFTDTSIDLSAPGLQIIYGPNEAGKTTARSAILNLLYDFDFRTHFDFVHPMAKLQVGGRIRSQDGDVLQVVRFKRNKDPLMDKASGEPITFARWNQILQGMSKDDYEKMLTLGWKELVEGTAELVERGGALGETVFSAGLGIQEIDAVLKNLDNQASSLFAPRASTKIINAALKSSLEAQKRVASLSLRPTHYAEIVKNREAAQQLREILDGRRGELQQEHERLITLRGVLPDLVRRRQMIAERDELLLLGPLPPKSWADRFQEVIEERDKLEGERFALETRIVLADERLSKITVDKTLLSVAQRVDGLAEMITAYEQGRSDRHGLAQQSRDAERDALTLLSSITKLPAEKADLDKARTVLLAKQAFGVAREEWTTLHAKLVEATTVLKSMEDDLSDIEAQLAQLPETIDLSPLNDAVSSAVSQGDLDRALSSAQSEVVNAYGECVEAAARLGIPKDRFCIALENPSPSGEEVEELLRKLQEADAEARAATQQAVDAQARVENLTEELNRLASERELPSEEDLLSRRKLRDATWKLIKSAWLDDHIVTGEGTPYENEQQLASYHESTTHDADDTVDRLWREADRTARRSTINNDLERERAQLEKALRKAEKIRSDAQNDYAIWRESWPVLPIPRSPDGLRQWMLNLERLRALQGLWTKAKAAHRGTFRNLKTHRNRLSALAGQYGFEVLSGNDIGPLLERAKILLQELETNSKDRLGLEKQQRQIERKFPNARKTLNDAILREQAAANAFRKLLEPYANDVTSPVEGRAVLDQFEKLDRSIDARDSLVKRIVGIDDRSVQFENEVADVLLYLGETASEPSADVVRRLVQSVKEARDQEAQQKTVFLDRDDAEKGLRKVQENQAGVVARLNKLANETHLTDIDELAKVAESAIKLADLDDNIAKSDEQLIGQGGGRSVSELDTSSQELDIPAINVHISDINNNLDIIRDQLQEAIKKETELERQQREMDGSDAAALEAALAESEFAKALEASERYVRLVLARHIADEAIRRYSDKHQDPLLSRASYYLEQLTNGRCKRVAVEENLKSGPRLSAIYSNGEERSVPELSDGTRDQLYFALRLAAIQETVDSGYSMPVVLDDVLINFDDNRARAAINCLAELAQSSQVLLFTHHEHLISLARNTLSPKQFSIHELT